MSFKIIFDESHGEQISNLNCRGLSYILEKLNVISFRLISGPITLDKIEDEDLLFLGAPMKKFFDFEIQTIEYFISQGKYLIIVCPMPMPFNFSLNELTIKFGVQFQHNVVQDRKHNLNGAMYFPIIKHFIKDPITQGLKEMIYSGCSIKILDPAAKALAITDEDAEPPSVPIIATAQNDHIIFIGGHTLFEDDKRYGIKAKNNIKFVANLFRTLIRQTAPQSPVRGPSKEKALKPIDPKKAKKLFERQTEIAIAELHKKMKAIDDLFTDILKMIEKQRFELAETSLNDRYIKFKTEIQLIYQQLMEQLNELDSRIHKNLDFPTIVQESTERILVIESEALSKLDMIRFNLSNRIKSEKVRFGSR
ncbi:MAG: hypothetical protein ACTSRS_10620 [Candidatus Helarchaeota archaeon]